MTKKLIPAYLLTLVNVLGFSILIPILPFVVQSYGAPKWVYGLLLTFYSAFQFIGAPYLGALSDQKGRKPILLISQAGTLLSWLVFLGALFIPKTPFLGLALPLWIIGFSRILDGITGGSTSVTNAYVADITTDQEKTYVFGYLGGIGGLGMILGPGIGGYTSSTAIGHAGTLIAAIIISCIALVTIFTWLKESHVPKHTIKQKRQSILHGLLVFTRIKEIKPDPLIKLLYVVKFFFSTMLACYISTITLFMIDLFSLDEQQLGFFMLVVGLFLSFNQAVMTKMFIRKFGGFRTLIIGLALCSIGLVGLTLTKNIYWFIGIYYFVNLGLSLCFPTFNSLISLHANPEKQGEIMGVSESISSVAMASFPVVAAALYGLFGFKVYYLISFFAFTGLILALIGSTKLSNKMLE